MRDLSFDPFFCGLTRIISTENNFRNSTHGKWQMALATPNSNQNGKTIIFGRLLAGCCFLLAALLAWTQQGEYRDRGSHRLRDSKNGPALAWFAHGRDIPAETTQPFSCKIDQLEMNLPQAPDLIIAGAAKCGTTTLAHWLLNHPSVLPTKKLECHFFNAGIHQHEVDRLLEVELDSYNQTKKEDLICELRMRYLHQWPDLSQTNNQQLQKSTGRLFTFDKVRLVFRQMHSHHHFLNIMFQRHQIICFLLEFPS